MRHAGACKDGIINARGAFRLHVKPLEERVDVVRTLRTPDQGQIGRRDAEPATCGRFRHRYVDRFIGLLGIEHQVFAELFIRQFQVSADRAETDVFRGVTARAIIHEIARSALQRRDIAGFDIRVLESSATGRKTLRGSEQYKDSCEPGDHVQLTHGRPPSPVRASSCRSSCSKASTGRTRNTGQ